MKRILMITCLCTPKEKYDGERIKNTYVYKSLAKKVTVDVIDLSKHKIFNTFRIFWNALFRKRRYDFIFISKDPHGANIIQKILFTGGIKPSKIVYFEIGPFLYNRINDGSINKETFINDRLIVVETNSMKNELLSLGFKNVDIFPNFKEIFDVKFKEQKYPKQILKLAFFSRIEEPKGIYDLIDVLKQINNSKVKYTLDVYGRIQNKDEEKRFFDSISGLTFIEYKGKIDLNCVESYEVLREYDAHVFPTKYPEGFPGTIIDFFIAGVPTISSTFARANDILTNHDSIIYEQGNNDDLYKKLFELYDNQNVLESLRINSYQRRNQFSVESFDGYLDKLLGELYE